MPEERSAQVLEAWNRIVSEGRSLVAFFAHQTEAKICRLNHVDIICSIADGQCHLVLREFLHECHDLRLLAWGGAIDDDGLGGDEELAELCVHEFIVESDCNDHARYKNLITAFNTFRFNNEFLDLFEKHCCICVGVFEREEILASSTLGFQIITCQNVLLSDLHLI